MSIYERECPRCAEIVKRKAQVCRYCGHEFEDWEAQRRQIEIYEYQQTDEWLLEVNIFLESCGSSDALTDALDVGKLREHLLGLTSLWLWDKNLTSLPESIGNLTGLTGLDLSENNLTSLPESIGQLTGLTSLSLSENNLTILPESISNLTGLTHLGLAENNLTILSESIGQLTGLTSLWLSENNLTSLSESIGNLSHLEKLSLSNNNFTELSSALERLSGLKWLSLDGNDVQHLSKDLAMVSECLRLDYRQIERFCLNDSVPIRSIEWFIPKDTSFEVLQEQIEQCASLSNISRLCLDYGDLSTLPDNIGQLVGLNRLYIYNSNLKNLPESIGQLTGLTSLSLSKNNLTRLPESIGNLTGLTNVYLRENPLTHLSPITKQVLANWITTEGLRWSIDNAIVKELAPVGSFIEFNAFLVDIGHYQADTYEVEVVKLKEHLEGLELLTLGDKNLTGLPESIASLTGLTELWLSDNNLTRFPESIGNLTGLTKLNLWENNLTILSESIGKLTGLTELSLGRNNLTSLPESICHLPELQELLLWDNPLTHLSPAMKQQLFEWDADESFALGWDYELAERVRQELRSSSKPSTQSTQVSQGSSGCGCLVFLALLPVALFPLLELLV